MQDYLNSLNPAQREAVTTLEGPLLIVAGAGSGKTRVLTFRIANLLQHGIKPHNILALTFTNKAAKEMKARIGQAVGHDVAKNLWMDTFHSIFLRILRKEAAHIGFPSSFSIYDTSTSRTLLARIIKEENLSSTEYKPAAVASRISMAKNLLIFPQTYMEDQQIQMQDRMAKRPEIGTIYEKYMQALRAANAMDFDDILVRTYILFAKRPEVLKKYQDSFTRILVDEYQDTNTVQNMILNQLAGVHHNICVVGDDAQSIYAFRGAKIQNILNFPKAYPEVKTIKLETNYRSTSSIVSAANALIAHNPKQIKKTCVAHTKGGAGIRIESCLTDITEAYTVAQSILKTALSQQATYDQFAVLYRTNTQARQIETALREKNIPYQIYGGQSFYERKEIQDILAYFRLIINPNDGEALLRIINVPARNIGETTKTHLAQAANARQCSIWEVIEKLEVEQLPFRDATLRALIDFREKIKPFLARVQTDDAYSVAKDLYDAVNLPSAYTSESPAENESRIENLQEIFSNIQEATSDLVETGEAELVTLGMFMDEVALMTDHEKDDQEDEPRVVLTTVHSSKGLEFDYVYIVGMEDGIFPSQRSSNDPSGIEEERRLAYVAVTRAAKELSIFHAQSRRSFGRSVKNPPSRFLSEIEPGYLKRLAIQQQGISASAGENARDYASPTPTSRRPASSPKGIDRPVIKREPEYHIQPQEITPPDQLQVGDKVVHAHFGRGVITQFQGEGADAKAIVEFEIRGRKTLMLKFAKLKRID